MSVACMLNLSQETVYVVINNYKQQQTSAS
jgi:hypothetical protein